MSQPLRVQWAGLVALLDRGDHLVSLSFTSVLTLWKMRGLRPRDGWQRGAPATLSMRPAGEVLFRGFLLAVVRLCERYLRGTDYLRTRWGIAQNPSA